MPIAVNGTEYALLEDVSKRLRVSRTTLWRLRRAQQIPLGSKFRGRLILYTPDEVEQIRLYVNRIEPIQSLGHPLSTPRTQVHPSSIVAGAQR